jgi:dephospho-CoA kinase
MNNSSNNSSNNSGNSSSRIFRVGLTGGIASGKSLAADMFAAHRVPVIDTDVIAREIVAPGQTGLDAIVERFGAELLTADGTLDRAAMRRRIFADPVAREDLETLLHPLIRARALLLAEGQPGPYQLFAVPLLVETGFADLVDRVLVIDCPEELQRSRLMARDTETARSADAMIAAQATRAERLAGADDIIVNDGTPIELEQSVARLHQRYLELADLAA